MIPEALPGDPGPLETGGCPDQDGDAVADKDDQCPDIAGLPALNGCPDTDNDGFADFADECPDQPGRWNGCPTPILMASLIKMISVLPRPALPKTTVARLPSTPTMTA